MNSFSRAWISVRGSSVPAWLGARTLSEYADRASISSSFSDVSLMKRSSSQEKDQRGCVAAENEQLSDNARKTRRDGTRFMQSI